jgi:hypothetical protein
VVDPVVGTNTIGSQITGPDPNNSYYDRPWLDSEYSINRYQVPLSGNGVCTAYVYCYHEDTDWTVSPFLYTEINSTTFKKKSRNENNITVGVWPPSSPVGWRSNTFQLDGNLTEGEYVWFGVHNGWFTTRFDYGGQCYKGWFDWDLYPDYEGDPLPYIHIGSQWPTYCTIKWSWYFSYTAFPQNYTRTLTQGVKVTDSRTVKRELKRTALQNVNGSATLARLPTFIRSVLEQAIGTDLLKQNRGLLRKCEDTAALSSELERQQSLIRILNDTENTAVSDGVEFPLLFLRSVQETGGISDTIQKWGDYFRGLYIEAGNIAETSYCGDSYRTVSDTVQADGVTLRHLFIFIKILTTSIVHDFILRRFLVAREELKLKSCITRELTLESKIN